MATGWNIRLRFSEVAGIIQSVQVDELRKTDLNKFSRLFLCDLFLNA